MSKRKNHHYNEPVTDMTLSVAKEDSPSQPACQGCKHYKPLNDTMGRCHRYPPTVAMAGLMLTSDGPIGIFPITLSIAACGEFSSSAS